MNEKKSVEVKPPQTYSNEEINQLAEWFEELTIKQAFFIKESYEAMMKQQAYEFSNGHVH